MNEMKILVIVSATFSHFFRLSVDGKTIPLPIKYGSVRVRPSSAMTMSAGRGTKKCRKSPLS